MWKDLPFLGQWVIRLLGVGVASLGVLVLFRWIVLGKALRVPGFPGDGGMLGTTAICFALLGVVIITQDVRTTFDRILFTVGSFWVFFTASLRLFLLVVLPDVSLEQLFSLGEEGQQMTVGTALGLVLVALSIVLITFGRGGWATAGRVIARVNVIVLLSAVYFVMTQQTPILMPWVFEKMSILTFVSFLMSSAAICMAISLKGYEQQNESIDASDLSGPN